MSLLSKFLLIAKCCYEQRNFATAMQILAGLENLIVRQLPVSLRLCSVTALLIIVLFQYGHECEKQKYILFYCKAWKILPAKVAEVMEELKAVEVQYEVFNVKILQGWRICKICLNG